ncbi:hypothetical protein BCI9360_00038 [Bacillus sp. CECT 9360]|nr:hypothetical protein BCI9360_00038 [Bacillus sp. CECT 9360]
MVSPSFFRLCYKILLIFGSFLLWLRESRQKVNVLQTINGARTAFQLC